MRWLVLLVVACGGAKPRPAVQHACVALATARADAAAADDRNRQALRDAIGARGLELVTLPARVVPLDTQSHEWRIDGTQILAPMTERSCGLPPPADAEFVRSAAGELWALLPAPSLRSQRAIYACACMSTQPVRCGGAAPEPIQLTFELPAGTTFRGQLAIEYPIEVVSISYADAREKSGCPPMPPPPP